MSDQSEKTAAESIPEGPVDEARRALLRRGVRLAYVAPAVLAALRAAPSSAVGVSGPPLKGVLARHGSDVPADLLTLIAEAERGSRAA